MTTQTARSPRPKTDPKKAAPTLPKRGFSIPEAAGYLGIPEKTIRNGTGRKSEQPFPCPFKRFGRRILFLREDLDAFLEGLPSKK